VHGGVSGKFLSYLGKIRVCPEKFFDSQKESLKERADFGQRTRKRLLAIAKFPGVNSNWPGVLRTTFLDSVCFNNLPIVLG
jgi:hypothetical protein